MKIMPLFIFAFIFILVGCTGASATYTPNPAVTTAIPPSPTLRFTLLPTWTPGITPSPRATITPRNTATPGVTPGSNGVLTILPGTFTTELLVDRPVYATLAKPANLVAMKYDPNAWLLNTSYPAVFMGYSLTHRSIYGCKLEPVQPATVEGKEIEQYTHPLGATKFEVQRVGQAGVLLYASYCTGTGVDRTCYQMTPGDDHEKCTQAAEEVLSSFKLVANLFFSISDKTLNRWTCQDAAGTVGLCQISFSRPLNALAFTPDGQVWAAGNNGLLLHREGQTWKEFSSPATHALLDLNFSSATSGWAVGEGAEVLRWDGNAWNEVLPYHGPGEGPGGSTQVLYSVDILTVNEAWMVGNMKGIDGKNRPYALHWNGKDLLEQTTFPECNCGLKSVLIRNRDDVYAAGGSDLGAIIFHYNGLSWTSTLLPGADIIYTLIQSGDGSLWAGGIEVSRDQQDARGALFHWDGYQWHRVAVPPVSGGIYALSTLPGGQIVLGGDFTALRNGLDWQPILTDIAGYGWIVDIELDQQGGMWALTHSGNIFKLGIKR